MRTLVLTALLSLSAAPFPQPTHQESPMPATQTSIQLNAAGTFDIQLAPTGHAPDDSLQSLSLAKTYHGDLEATSRGEMLASGGPPSTSGGYVAMERITGTLAGRTGSFSAMQLGSMATGTAPQMTMQIVPGSGTGDLSGLYGTMTIAVTAGQHHYTIHYGLSGK